MSGYGLFRGLNEAYGAYREREREIEDKNRRMFADEQARKEAARREEEYEYGISRRKSKEEAEDLALRTGRLQYKQAETTYNEFVANTADRAKKNKLDLQKAENEARRSGLMYDKAEIELKAAKSAEKYNQWTNDWLQGGTMEDVVKKFNSDDDDTNNIKTVTGNEEKGWHVVMENGREMHFKDRDAVAIHLQSMADKNFHQTYLLQVEAQKAALQKAIDTGAKKTADQTSKDKKQWEDMTRMQVKDYFTESIKESIVSLGSEGARDIAGDVRAVVDSIGASSGYGMVNSDVTRVANQMAKRMLVKEPAERRRMAEERLEAARKAGADIPEEGDQNYEEVLNRQMAKDYDRAYDQYKRAVYTKFASINADGTGVVWKDYSSPADASGIDRLPQTEERSRAGLERPSDNADTLAAADEDGNMVDPEQRGPVIFPPNPEASPEAAQRKIDEAVGGDAYREKLAGLASKDDQELQYKAKLENKLGITKQDARSYRKGIGDYVKSPEFLKLPVEEQYQILEMFEDALTKPQIRKAKAAIRKEQNRPKKKPREESYGLM